MRKLTRNDLHSLEHYAEQRPRFRDVVLQHKRRRRVRLGENATLYFEDRLTVQYQIQEMLRAERIFEPAAIQDELDAYNPLIPDGGNWKVTFMLEYEDAEQRREALQRLTGIENLVWILVQGFERVLAVADEDMPRSTEAKTSAVHFLRFELTPEMILALNRGAALSMGIDHPEYRVQADVTNEVRDALLEDFSES
jgi:hypothetical protein